MDKYQGQYKEFRKDGWPLCPNCGKNELWSKLLYHPMFYVLKPSMNSCINDGLQCHYCSWQSVEMHRQEEDRHISQERSLINQT